MASKQQYLEELALLRRRRPQDYSARIMVNEEKIAVISDVHIPYHDETLLAEAFARIEAMRLDAIVWLGDLLDMSHFSTYGQTDKESTWAEDQTIVRGVIETASNIVPVQYWSMGNHEHRFLRKNDYHTTLNDLAHMVGLQRLIEDGSLVISENPSLDALDGEWMLTHPESYGSTPLVVPGKIADLEQQNVMAGHAHHWGMGMSPSGKYVCVETGGGMNPKYVHYNQQNVTTHRKWVPGYFFLINGVPTGYRKGSR